MMHLAMSYFDKVALAPEESDSGYPRLSERVDLIRSGQIGRNWTYVTKRDYGWFQDSEVDALRKRAVEENIGIIHMVRDPRDVLISRHAGHGGGASAYVTEEHWSRSVSAAEHLLSALGDYPRKMEVRYEDLVLQPERVEEDMARVFGLRPRRSNRSITEIRSNLDRMRSTLDPSLDEAAHGIRDISSESIGRWEAQTANVLDGVESPVIRDQIVKFIERHGYAG